MKILFRMFGITFQARDSSTDYFQRLEDAVKKRKMMGNNNAGILPIMSPESLFTKAIPLGMSLKTFCCSPSNRIGVYYSPETMELGDMYAASRCSRNKEVSRFAQQSIHFVSKRPPWKNPGKRPKKEVADYVVPVLTENKLLFPMGRQYVDISHVFEGNHQNTLTSASKGSFDSIQLNESNENTFLADQQELVKHYKQIFLHVSNMMTMKKEKADAAKLERKSAFVDKTDGLVPLKSKDRFYPQIVDSPRSLHTVTLLQHLPTSSDIMKAADDIVRYQYYVETGVDESFITPINERWIRRAVHLTGKYVKDGLSPDVIQSTLEHIKEEVQHDYVLSMRKAIVDYILQDETERHRLNLNEIDEVLHVITTGFIARSHTIQILTPEWRSAVLDAHGAVSGLLHKLNPQALELAALWQNLYSNKFFLDTMSNDFREHMPYELSSFVSREKLCVSSVRQSLDKDWMPMSASLLKQAVPIPPNSDLVGFYEAMRVLMGNQIRKLVEDSVIYFANFFNVFRLELFDKISKSTTEEAVTDFPLPQKYCKLFSSTAGYEMESIRLRNTPPFAVTLKYLNGVYSVDPSFEELQADLLEVLDFAVSQGSGFLRVDAEKVEPSQRMLLAVTEEDELVKVAKVHISCISEVLIFMLYCSASSCVVHLNRNEPKGLMHYFKPFEDLANMDPESFATEFKLQNKPLQEYEDTLNKFQARAIEAETSSENVVDCGFVRVRCQEFKDILIEKAKHVSLLLKVQVLGQMTAANVGVIGRSEHISREITKMPTNSDEAVSLRKFLVACPNELAVLEKILVGSKQKDEFLERYMFNIPETDFRIMLTAYEWPKRVRAVIEVHTKRIQEEYEHYENQLKQRRTDFASVLERSFLSLSRSTTYIH
ncbi:hypothetical protein O6H91_Y473500 [Diphasiastrum complanatum]|nr:hypothetical protein O6H91_Y473500 [Diphasiastrum complanatum]